MATYTVTGPTPSFENPPQYYMWEIDASAITADEDFTVTLCTVPAGIKVLDAKLAVTRAEAGSTSPTGGIVLGDEPLVATSTSLATETVVAATAAEIVDAIQDGASASQSLTFQTARSTGTVTTAFKVIVTILAGRLVM